MFALLVGLACAVAARGNADTLCVEAARSAARATGLSEDMLIALSRVETGRGAGRDPWPWALNHHGTAYYPQDRQAALRQIRVWLDAGDTRFDVGCFQINMHWHAEHFNSVEEMLDPDTNATYAAQFLTRLYRETGSWDTSIGYYHSRSPDLARAYHARVTAAMEAPLVSAPPRPSAPARPAAEWHAMPRSGTQRRGSLFPLS